MDGIAGEGERRDRRADAERNLLFYGRDFADLIVERAAGAHIFDQDGRAIIDFSSGQMCATLGHNHPDIVAAIHQACREVLHLDSTKLSPAVIDLARELCALLPPQLQKAMFLSTGGESNDAAIRLAKLTRGGFEVVAFTGSWHGMTGGAQGSTYASARRGYGPAPVGTFALPAPNAYRCPIKHCEGSCDATCLDVGMALYDQWTTGAPAAVIAEPVQSAGGMIVPPDGYFRRLRDHCDARGLALVFDEAQTGLGRVGAMFAFETEGVVPDILTLSKTLGAGVPLSAVVTSDAIGQEARAKGFNFYTSHVSDPLPARVGLAVVRALLAEQLVERAARLGARLRGRLQELAQRYEMIGDVRGRGLLLGVELVEDRHSKRPALDMLLQVTKRCLERGLNVNKAGGANAIWRLAPPLTISEADLDKAMDILDAALRECGAH
ncbi:MAG: aspartate aminotransferase family protein [Alphaproteobacteria bacterium]|nr:aspartate aminotransferase family protein [Alphaproteobacteria bacterium]